MSVLRVDQLRATDGLSPKFKTGGIGKVRLRYDQTVPQIDESDNISTVVDGSTGSYGARFTNFMRTGTHSVIGTSMNAGLNLLYVSGPDGTASGISVNPLTRNHAGTPIDADRNSLAVYGDLA